MEGHDNFFLRVIHMIPRELYRAQEDDSLNERYFKHRLAPLEPAERKKLSQKRKKEKYDMPGGSDDSDGDGDLVDGDEDEDDEEVSPEEDAEEDGQEPGQSALKSRDPSDARSLLQARLAELRKRRKLTGKENEASSKRTKSVSKPVNKSNKTFSQRQPVADLESILDHSGLMESIADVDFNGIVQSGIDSGKSVDAGKPGSKMRRLKRMLEEAESKRKRLDDLNQKGSEGKKQAIQEQWADALKDASGTKSVTDTKKIRKAIKKREKSKEKSAMEWQNRLDAVSDAKTARVEKREKNIFLKKGIGVAPVEKEGAEGAGTGSNGKGKAAGASHAGIKGKPRPGFEGKKAGGAGGAQDFLNAKHQHGHQQQQQQQHQQHRQGHQGHKGGDKGHGGGGGKK